MRIPIVVICGPTASGKSACALAVAKAFDGVIINADSMQVYRDLRVLSARPTAEEEAEAPHRLYGTLDASEKCSAGRWREMAMGEILAASVAGKLPILVGGTGLYIESLLYGIAAMPAIPEAVRDAAMARHAEIGGAAFRSELAAMDPFGAGRLDPGDTQRLVRAYEIVKATGTPQREWQRREVLEPAPVDPLVVKLLPERPGLYHLCDARLDKMIDEGGLDEVRTLAARGLDPMLPAMKAVGVPPLLRHVAGGISLAEALEIAKRDTRRYAKRQLTWFRNRLQSGHAFSEKFSKSLLPEIFAKIRQTVLTGKD
ncbi:MAG: tRNA (adenosine(37)-N6)-dimethylallyltransferase MiaA [Alphaproteobacteria bacterium]|nr:tRNA (adenosine(37)-N6)-dimethylallyltransferase MiaA [Alphaproteobacteria bacterium]